MITVFISHSTHDRAIVELEIIPFLESLGITPWYSRDDIKVAVTWERSIREALIRSDWVLVVLSPSSVKSDWVRTEVHWALENKTGKVMPVMLVPCDPSELHIKLSGIHYADYSSDRAAARHQLATLFGGTILSENRGQDAEPAVLLPQQPLSISVDLGTAITELNVSGKYKVIRLIARTGSGMTFLARQIALNQDVIVKSYSFSGGEIEQRERIVDLIQQRSRLRHPILLTPNDVISTDSALFVVTPYLSDVESIRELLGRKVQIGELISAETVCQLLSQVALGLSYAHALGVSHLSLDPWDILVNSENRVWLAGFEKDMIYNYYSIHNYMSLGTRRYCSPEQLRGQPLDCTTDIYCIGIILLELLTGTYSFRNDYDNIKDLIQSKSHSIPSKLRDLCLTCLEPDRHNRFADAGVLFERFLSVRDKKYWWKFWR